MSSATPVSPKVNRACHMARKDVFCGDVPWHDGPSSGAANRSSPITFSSMQLVSQRGKPTQKRSWHVEVENGVPCSETATGFSIGD